jgi:hypothetical protein
VKRNLVLLFTIALLLATAARLPAPIQEIPEPPSPTPAVAPTPAAKPPPSIPNSEAKKEPAQKKEKKSVSENTMPASKPTNETPSINAPTDLRPRKGSSDNGTAIPKGAVHLVIHTNSDARKIFTYFRFPPAVAPAGTTGLYRLEVSPDGAVAAVTILKSMGSDQDLVSMKVFVTWRAVPGPLRIVDIPRRTFQFYRAKSF